MVMRILIVSLYATLAFSLNCFGCEHDKILFKLSVVSQNANADFECLASDVAPSRSLILSYAKKIDALLDSLVNQGYFKNEKIELKSPKDLSLQEQAELSKIVGNFLSVLALRYGMYSSREMLDFGLRRGVINVETDQPIVLNVRMPNKTMEKFLMQIQKFK